MSDYSITDQHICDEMVTKIAKLAKLRLTEEEAEKYQENFTGLLDMFHALDELETDAEYQPEKSFIEANACREDVVVEPAMEQLEKASQYYNASSSYFDVPQFLGNNDE